MEELYCSKCHKFITFYVQDADGIQLIHNGKPMGAKFRGNVFTDDKGHQRSGLALNCKAGHPNYIKGSKEDGEDMNRPKYNYGKICKWHRFENRTCPRKRPCGRCIVKQDWDKAHKGEPHGNN